MPEEPN